MIEPTRILVVDDDPLVLKATVRALQELDAELLTTATGEGCIAMARRHSPDILLLDVVLPDADGIALCRQLKADPDTSGIFVILLSSQRTGTNCRATGLESGADGYIARPISNRELIARVRALDRIRTRHIKLQTDERTEKLAYEARHDALTGVLNRHALLELIEGEETRAIRYGHPVGLLMIDVDRLKMINDQFGHPTGDIVLKEVAGVLKSSLRSSDFVIRYGGDEFLVVLTETRDDPARVAQRIRDAIVNTKTLRELIPDGVSVSIGSIYWDPNGDHPLESALATADQRMYDDKGRLAR